MAIQQDFKEWLELLSAHAVESAIIARGTVRVSRGKRRFAICAH